MYSSIPARRLTKAWAVYTATWFPSLTRKTRAEYQSCMKLVFSGIGDPVTVGSVLSWHRATMLKKYSTTYANMCLHVARTVTRRAAFVTGDNELMGLFWQVQPMRQSVLSPRCPPQDFLARALRTARNPAESAFFMLAGLGGLRLGELLGLRAGDLGNRVVRVERQRNKATRKNRRPHTVRVDHRPLWRALLWVRDNRAACTAATGWHRGGSDGYLFPWSKRYVEGMVDRLREHLGDDVDRYLPKGLGMHAFRHWGATELARAGATPIDVQAWLGHSTPNMAMRYIARVRGETSAAVSTIAKCSGVRWSNFGKSRSGNGGRGHAPQTLNRSSRSIGRNKDARNIKTNTNGRNG